VTVRCAEIPTLRARHNNLLPAQKAGLGCRNRLSLKALRQAPCERMLAPDSVPTIVSVNAIHIRSAPTHYRFNTDYSCCDREVIQAPGERKFAAQGRASPHRCRRRDLPSPASRPGEGDSGRCAGRGTRDPCGEWGAGTLGRMGRLGPLWRTGRMGGWGRQAGERCLRWETAASLRTRAAQPPRPDATSLRLGCGTRSAERVLENQDKRSAMRCQSKTTHRTFIIG
jgi:hypothetical protein